jgi:glycerol dehydrogenase-like iron-containing ADH family enzyme
MAASANNCQRGGWALPKSSPGVAEQPLTTEIGEILGRPFDMAEAALGDVLADVGSYLAVVQDPPWTGLAARLPAPTGVIRAGSMELDDLERVAAGQHGGGVVVGIGGGAALDTAKFVAWRRSLPLFQAPSITSVDAAFTDAIGVRVDRRVRYVGRIAPRMVVLDLPLIRSAPAHLNRAGIGDVLSCHTGLYDWRLASGAGHGPPWSAELAGLGETLLAELESAIPEIAAVSEAGVRFLAGAYRRIGAACAAAGHSRFEEGSEHFWAYAYEAAGGQAPIHGELIALGVVALSVVQDNRPEWAAKIVARSGARAHPADLGVAEEVFRNTLAGLAAYARAVGLDYGVADHRPITPVQVEAAWRAVQALPRRDVGA